MKAQRLIHSIGRGPARTPRRTGGIDPRLPILPSALLLVLSAWFMGPMAARADFVSPTGATVSGQSNVVGSIDDTYNRSGLSQASGTATHEAKTASLATLFPQQGWTVSYSLGGPYELTHFYLWDNNDESGGDDLKDFELVYYANGLEVGRSGTLQSPAAGSASAQRTIAVETFTISAQRVDRVDLVAKSNWGGGGVNLAEVAFEGSKVTASIAVAAVPRTGQTTCWADNANVIPCAGSGHDGDLRPGVPWPNPRFTDNGDGTVTDHLTGLVWLRDAYCKALPNRLGGKWTWHNAFKAVRALENGKCGLGDGSTKGDWRLPSLHELQSLVDYERSKPALSDTAGTGHWTAGDPFTNVQKTYYWTSTTVSVSPGLAWAVYMDNGDPEANQVKVTNKYIWPVRDRK